ncbi:hypothetical protein ABZP36_024883 [Zizania latifolia]
MARGGSRELAGESTVKYWSWKVHDLIGCQLPSHEGLHTTSRMITAVVSDAPPEKNRTQMPETSPPLRRIQRTSWIRSRVSNGKEPSSSPWQEQEANSQIELTCTEPSITAKNIATGGGRRAGSTSWQAEQANIAVTVCLPDRQLPPPVAVAVASFHPHRTRTRTTRTRTG